MKRVLAILLVLVMVFTLTACKSKEQRAADKFLREMEKRVDGCIEAFEEKDNERLQELQDELSELGDDYQSILEDLKATDPDAAAQFEEDIIELGEKLVEGMS